MSDMFACCCLLLLLLRPMSGPVSTAGRERGERKREGIGERENEASRGVEKETCQLHILWQIKRVIQSAKREGRNER